MHFWKRLFSIVIASSLLTSISKAADESGTIRVATQGFQIVLRVQGKRLEQAQFGPASADLPQIGKSKAAHDEFYPAGGGGYFWEPAFMATHADGNTSTQLDFVSSSDKVVDDNITETRIELKDPGYPLFVTLCFRAYRQNDIIEEWAEVHHDEGGIVTLARFASSSPVFRTSEDLYMTQFPGDYSHEMNVVEEKLTSGSKIVDSKLGTRADYYVNPSFILSLGAPAQEDAGMAIGGSLAWSGSFQFNFEMQDNRLRVLAGMNPYDSAYRLDAGKTFQMPAMVWTFSRQGVGQMTRNFHRWARTYALRDGFTPRPIPLNNWEATHFDFDENKLVALFDDAKAIGADLFLLDDGWFGNNHPRDDDHAGLGDWAPNARKLPHGISYLVDQAQTRGLKFGIWVEPEMVNPQSDLFEAHPQWAIQQPKRDLNYFRNQLVLDLTRPEVHQYVFGVVDDLLTKNPGIAYVKWDCNRYITQPGSTYLAAENQQNLWIDYVNALYDVMQRLSERHPKVVMMVCSGGGGRVDFGSLRYFHTFWPSDNTDPVARVKIQWGYSQFFPAVSMAGHITRSGNRPIKFAADVAMSGTLGLDLDASKLSEDRRQAIAAAVAAYKGFRDIIVKGDLYRLESPYSHNRASLMYVTTDKSRAVLFVYQMKDQSDPVPPVVLRGLDPARHYQLKEVDLPATQASAFDVSRAPDGASLMSDGFVPPCKSVMESTVIELTAH